MVSTAAAMPFQLIAATSPPGSASVLAEERRWQPYSSTDIYRSGAAPQDADPSYFDPISAESLYHHQPSHHHHQQQHRQGSPSSPSGSRSPLNHPAWSPTRSPLRLAAALHSVRSFSGQHVSPEQGRAPSPSYFASVVPASPGSCSSVSGRQPTITFTDVPAESGIVAPTSPTLFVGSHNDVQSPTSAQSVLGHGGHVAPSVSALPLSPGPPSSPSGAGDGATASTAPVSPGGSTQPKLTSSQSGFFASLRPSSPRTFMPSREEVGPDRRRERGDRDGHRDRDRDRSFLGTMSGLEMEQQQQQRLRRPSSVLEQVGIVWERFGRKVHHVRNSTSESGPAGMKRGSGALGAGSPASEAFDDRPPSTGSSLSGSQTSPLQASLSSSVEADRRGSASSTTTATEQRLPAWLEESLAGAAVVEAATSPTSASFAHRDVDSRSPAPSVGSNLVASRNTVVAPAQGASGGMQRSNPNSPAHVAIEHLDHGSASGGQASRGAIVRQHSAGSSSLDGGLSPTSLHLRRHSLLDRVLIQVTEDNERFSVVDVSGVDSADAIKERMFAKLHLFDEDYSNFQLFRTEIGQTNATGPVVNDDALLALCLQMGDDRGTLKFLVHQTSPPTKPASRALPPPLTTLSPRRAMRELEGPSEDRAEHRRAESQSSKSSVSDALINSDVPVQAGSGTDSPHRRSGSGLHRSRAQTRRALPDAPATDEVRSPVGGSGAGGRKGSFGGGHDRRSTASSADGSERARGEFSSSAIVNASHENQLGRLHSPSPPFPLPYAHQNQQQQASVAPRSGDRERSGPSTSTRQADEQSMGPSPSYTQQQLQQQQQQQQQQQRRRAGSQAAEGGPRLGDRMGGPLLPRSLQPVGRPAPNSHGQQRLSEADQNGHARLRSEGEEGMPASKTASQLTIHSAKSMDDLRKRPAPPAPPMPPNMNLAMLGGFERDGRYPNPAIARPSSATPGTKEPTHQVHRQLSSDAHTGRMPSPAMQPDPRALQRNRSAQAALTVSDQPNGGGGMRMPSAPGPMRAPLMAARDGMMVPQDPRLGNRPVVVDEARFGVHRVPQQIHHPQLGRAVPVHHTNPASPGFGYQGPPHMQQQQQQQYAQGPHTYDPHRSHQMSAPHPGEFGTRGPINPYGHQDPRLHGMVQGGGAGAGGPLYPARPHTLHDASFSPHHRPSIATSPPMRSREDPFTSLFFPASSSRQVSEFQMAAGRLEPGMTVQETMNHRAQLAGHLPQPSYGSRDLRRPATSAELHAHAQPRRPPVATMSPRRDQQAAMPPPVDWRPSPPAYQQHQIQSHQGGPAGNPGHAGHAGHASHSGQAGHAAQQRPATRSSQHQEMGGHQEPVRNESGSGRPNASERFSGSSFSSSASHKLAFSSEDRHGRGSIEDSYSTPTSTRSSQSSSANLDLLRKGGSTGGGEESRTAHEGDLEDEDLMNVRPLPRPPQTSEGAHKTSRDHAEGPLDGAKGLREGEGTPKSTDDEGTLKANNVASLWNALSAGSSRDPSGTVTSHSDSGTPRADRPRSAAESVCDTPSAQSGATALNPDENGTVASFASFASFDDDESEAGTWAQPLDTDLGAPRLPLIIPDGDESKADMGEQTLQPGHGPMAAAGSSLSSSDASAASWLNSSPRRPELRLTIETPGASASHSGAPIRRASPNVSPHPTSGRLSSSSGQGQIGGGVHRSYSFAKRDNEWAFRPPPEQLYENLDDFFPKHDLDKPLLDTAGVPESSGLSSPKSDVNLAQLMPLASSAGSGSASGPLSRHKKSIRIVAQDRKKFLDRAERRVSVSSPEAGNTALARRRSTRLWGTKVIEMTPGQEASTPASAAPAESPSADSGHRPVFKWVKGDLIGKGTYGRVYLALNATTGEMIAVKQVELPRTASDREDTRQKGVVAALKSEIETLKDLDHPHIVAYLGFEETTSFLSIFLEYVPGGSVGSCLRKHGKFEEPTIKSFLHQILDGLAYLHSRGILHRDLKADNILVDFEGTCKISDFGTVRRSDDIYGNVEDMSLQGSIFWMAPEVVSLSKKGYSAKVDIWSLGCVVLEMFAGRRPWSDDEAVQAMFKIGAERRAPPIPPDVTLSRKAAHFLKNCFEIEPAKRPTAARLLDHVFSVPDAGWQFQQSSLWRHLKK